MPRGRKLPASERARQAVDESLADHFQEFVDTATPDDKRFMREVMERWFSINHSRLDPQTHVLYIAEAFDDTIDREWSGDAGLMFIPKKLVHVVDDLVKRGNSDGFTPAPGGWMLWKAASKAVPASLTADLEAHASL